MNNVLSQTSFDKLLAAFDADREQAGVKFEALRARLVKFFEWRSCENAEELADIVFDRITRKIVDGEQIQNVNTFSVSVAQYVLKEDLRRREHKFQPIDDNPVVENLAVTSNLSQKDEIDEVRFDCLDKCLAQFSSENRRLMTDYYDTDEKTMIATRKRLADTLNISLNTLRIRVCRLKAKLEECTVDCCNKFKK